jgi:hypothetical protein
MAALTSSIAVSVGLRKGFSGVTSRLSGGRLILMNTFVSYIASACAGFCNLTAMRYQETKTGIQVVNSEGTPVGTSQKCG